ncbi:MAG: hemerythrin domain-containing protein [Candidatus Omnitrophica bacterium]|nr:hemerythrin domain-containing protein [Candidatus Omnitrophota bacterium]
MDLLTRESDDHGQIFESIAFFKQSLAAISVEDYGYIRKVKAFIAQSIVAHFAYEESKIFRLILANGTLAEKKIIRDLQIEHINVLKEVDVFNDLVRLYNHGEKVSIKEMRAVIKGMISLMLKHARYEDQKLFPIIKAYQ